MKFQKSLQNTTPTQDWAPADAFGNYRDMLREISFSPIMAENLSFLRSKITAPDDIFRTCDWTNADIASLLAGVQLQNF